MFVIFDLIWNTPKSAVNIFCFCSLNILLRILKYPYSAYVLKQGFEKVLTTVVNKGGLNVTFNVDIVAFQGQSRVGTLISGL